MGRKVLKYKNVQPILLTGEIDQHRCNEIKNYIDVVLESTNKKNIVLDLSGVSLMDSSSIGLFMGKLQLLKSIGKELAICGGGSNIKKIIFFYLKF